MVQISLMKSGWIDPFEKINANVKKSDYFSNKKIWPKGIRSCLCHAVYFTASHSLVRILAATFCAFYDK